MARVVRVSKELYGRLGGCGGMDRCEMVRRVLRCWRNRHGGVLPEEEEGKGEVTTGGMVLRLVELQGLDEGLAAGELRGVLEWLVPRKRVVVDLEPGWVMGRDGVARKVDEVDEV
jgi:hypothetical protein